MKLYFDGGARPNPGMMQVCIVAFDASGRKTIMKDRALGHGTNNMAEWTALIWACEYAKTHGAKQIEIFGDSKLVVHQARGDWKIKQSDFLPFKAEFDRLSKSFDKVSLNHLLRDNNLAGHVLE